MGFLTKLAQEPLKMDFGYTVLEIVSLEDNRRTTVRIIDSRYSLKGEIVKVVEFPTFSGEFYPLYNQLLSAELKKAQFFDKAIREGAFNNPNIR